MDSGKLFHLPGASAIQSGDDAIRLTEKLFSDWRDERARLEVIDAWLKGQQPDIKVAKPTPEFKMLVSLSKAPWADLLCSIFAQALFVNGFSDPDTGRSWRVWETWQANNMEARQTPLHRATTGYGYAYTLVEAGRDAKGRRSVIKGLSPLRTFAVYADPANDEWPVYAIKVEPLGDSAMRVLLFDDTFKHTLMHDPTETTPKKQWQYVGRVPHGAGVVPIIRYCNQLDLDGNTPGEIEPVISVLMDLDKTALDALLIQHYNSWKKYIASGLAGNSEAVAQQIAENVQAQIKQNDIIVVPDGVDVKTLNETSMADLLRAQDALINKLAQVRQIPDYLLTGNLVNVQPDTLEAKRQSFTQKIMERQHALGASHVQTLRLAAHLEGDDEAAADVNSRVTWQDFSVRSISQAADALGKFASMLGVPKEALWERIPNVTKADVEEWKSMVTEPSEVSKIIDMFTDDQPTMNGVSIPDADADGDANEGDSE